jgi:Domain of unknown function (DUF4260)
VPIWFQRIENGAIAVAAAVAFVQLDFAWWWLVVLFIAFDVSMAGYAVSPRLGAWTYNIGHSYVGPAALVAGGWVADVRAPVFLGLTWAFHIAVDRLLGYGLKFTDRFTHTHLGEIGHSHEVAAAPEGQADQEL